MSGEASFSADSLSLIDLKIEKVKKQIDDYAGSKNQRYLNKLEKLNQKLRYLEYYRDNAVKPVRGE